MDIKLDNTGDLDFSSGDIHNVEGTAQHVTDLWIQDKGENKGAELFGVGARNYLLSENYADFLREGRLQLQKLGMKIIDIDIVDGQLVTNASYVDENNK